MSLSIIVLTALALVLAAALGVFKRRRIFGPDRLDPGESPLIILIGGGYGLLAWAVTQLAITALFFQPQPSSTSTTRSAPTLTTTQSVLFNITLDVVVFIALIVACLLTRRHGLRRMGINLAQLPLGLLTGLLGIIIVLPLIAWVDQATEWFWNHINYAHPLAHELLEILGKKPSPSLAAAIIFSAGVVAPLAEETFFRGYLQTILRYTTKSPWLAVFITSAAFALIHPFWSAPPIFILGICLGYAYERTGNLWTAIVIHALFNLTAIYMYCNVHAG